MRVYLAGTVSPDPAHLGWRGSMRERLVRDGQTPIDPLRAQNPATFSADGLSDASTPGSFFVASDVADLVGADVVFVVYMRGGPERYCREIPCCRDEACVVHGRRRQSLGTWSEFGIAAYLHKPIIVVTDDPDVANHPFVLRFAAIVARTVNGGYDWLRRMYL